MAGSAVPADNCNAMNVQSAGRWQLVLVLTWLLSSVYVWHYLDRGWWPNNAGAFSMSALRVHEGEVPHRDFDEIYTGGTSYLHALSYDVFGVRMTSPRRILFLFFLSWIPSFYWIATRFAPPPVASLFTLLAAAWSLPIYSEPIASWYNLFLATHGLAAVLRYFEGRQRRWLFVAGVCGGLSVLAKIVGVYFLAAVGLALLFYETQELAVAASDGVTEGPTRTRSVALIASAGVAACAAIVAIGVARVAGVTGLLHLVLPIGALAVVAIVAELSAAPTGLLERASGLWQLAWPVGLGAGVAITPFLLPFALSGSIGALVRGLLVDPQLRLSVTATAPPPVSWAALPVLLVLASPWTWPRVNALALGAVIAVPALLLVANGSGDTWYPAVIGTIRILLPTAVLGGVLRLLRDRQLSAPLRSARFAVFSVAAWCALVQFPVAETMYIYFAAPLGLLAVLAAADMDATAPRTLVVGAAVMLLAFSVLWINRSLHLGLPRPPFVADDQRLPLDIDRAGGIRVRQFDKLEYEELVKVVRRVARGEYIYATPDCPEVYFLTGFKNPTRTTYDFFDDPTRRVEQIERALEEHGVNAVIVNLRPQYSAPAPPALTSWLQQHYPTGGRIGDFYVLWRESPNAEHQGWSPSQH